VWGAVATGVAAIGADVIAAHCARRATRMARAIMLDLDLGKSRFGRRSESVRIALASMLGGSFLLFISSILGPGQNGGDRVDRQKIGVHAKTGDAAGGGFGDIGEMTIFLAARRGWRDALRSPAASASARRPEWRRRYGYNRRR